MWCGANHASSIVVYFLLICAENASSSIAFEIARLRTDYPVHLQMQSRVAYTWIFQFNIMPRVYVFLCVCLRLCWALRVLGCVFICSTGLCVSIGWGVVCDVCLCGRWIVTIETTKTDTAVVQNGYTNCEWSVQTATTVRHKNQSCVWALSEPVSGVCVCVLFLCARYVWSYRTMLCSGFVTACAVL